MCSFVTNLSSSCLRFKARSSEHRTHIGDWEQWPRFMACITFYCLLQVKVPKSNASTVLISWMHASTRDTRRETKFIYIYSESLFWNGFWFPLSCLFSWSEVAMNILFDLIFLKFYLHRLVAKKSNVKVLAYRILNFPIENHIKIKTWFLSCLSSLSESKFGHSSIFCPDSTNGRSPGEILVSSHDQKARAAASSSNV